ncbi:MAG: mechanosensitive ion channel family protein [Flavobacteriaceae bacterium]
MDFLKIESYLIKLFQSQGLSDLWSKNFTLLLLSFSILVLATIIFLIAKKVIILIFNKLAKKTKSSFDDFLINNNAPRLLSYIPFLLFLYTNMPGIFENSYNGVFVATKNIIEAISIIVLIAIVRALLRAISDYLKTIPALKDKPLESYLQVVMIFLWFIGGILILSILTGKDVWSFVTALGALSAVLLFVFKDTILGFVASVQIAVNDTVRIGDWISMPGNNADGDVISISLSTVQVQNFDKTITSIPTYKLISDSFINWRGMNESPGRRIKRSILIKISSIRFLNIKEVDSLSKIELIKNLITKKKNEIESFNKQKKIDKSVIVNGRNLTNLGLFRYYAESYLRSHPNINSEMTIMCRQLSPTTQGIPIEIYAFSNDKVWVNYERITSDIFDHLLASISYFDLECFELTSTLTERPR